MLPRAYLAIKNLPSQLFYGWEAEDDVYVSIMTDEIPLELMELSVCGSTTGSSNI